MRHLIGVADLSEADIDDLLARAAAYADDPRQDPDRLRGTTICCAFFEPSTRTRLGFEAAAHRLGADVIGFSGAEATSTSKGESLEDTVRVLGGYADLLVLRHPEEGAAARAADVASVPVINAGDGSGEHPTQALLDLFTLRQELGPLAGRTVALVGDLRHGRTVHSLAPLLQRAGAGLMQVPAGDLALPDGFATAPHVDLEEAAATADVLYVTRIQEERFSDRAAFDAARGSLRIDRALLDRTRSKAIILHPLPRVDELATDLDALPAAKYFDQARNGVPVRMALLTMLLEASR